MTSDLPVVRHERFSDCYISDITSVGLLVQLVCLLIASWDGDIWRHGVIAEIFLLHLLT